MMRSDMKQRKTRKTKKAGFTLIEAVVGIVLIAIAVLGLAEMFMLGVKNNMRSDRMTNASFLAQQQVDVIRNLTADELSLFESATGIDLNGDGIMDIVKDELLDLNGDGVNDYRRVAELQSLASTSWELEVLIFTAEQFGRTKVELLLNPQSFRVRARVNTVINR
jgi:Tfp pilus assembly protein PilV